MGPPLLILGVARSGTTLLRVMLDRNSQLAIPDESYFIPQLADRHRGAVDVDAFLDDLSRLPTLRDWDVRPGAVRAHLRTGCTPGEAIAAVYETYAEQHGKRRWGDKTPMYMEHLDVLERLFPESRYVHLIRDGRDGAMSFQSMPEGIVTRSWNYPRSAAAFARKWRTEVQAARRLGRRVGERYLELHYEQLVQQPEAELERICAFAGLPFEPDMVSYPGTLDLSAKPHHSRLSQPPTPGLRNWSSEMGAADVADFERIAGDELAACGYPLADPANTTGPGVRERLRLADYALRGAAWRTAGSAMRRSPLWRRSHPSLEM